MEAMDESKTKKSSPLKVGWITLFIGLALCLVWGMTGGVLMMNPDFRTMAAAALALPLLFASFILAIIGMCKDQPGKGTILFLATLILPSVVVLVSSVLSN